MIEEIQPGQYILTDGKLLSMTCNYQDNTIQLKLQVRKIIDKEIRPCTVSMYFEGVKELDVLDEFGTTGNYSDLVLTKLPDGLIYASFDPYGNSGEPNDNDNFVIKAENYIANELQ